MSSSHIQSVFPNRIVALVLPVVYESTTNSVRHLQGKHYAVLVFSTFTSSKKHDLIVGESRQIILNYCPSIFLRRAVESILLCLNQDKTNLPMRLLQKTVSSCTHTLLKGNYLASVLLVAMLTPYPILEGKFSTSSNTSPTLPSGRTYTLHCFTKIKSKLSHLLIILCR